MAAPVYFLSYSRKNILQIKTIAETLMIHGIEVWQDISNLGQGMTESLIRNAISEGTNGLLMLATPESVTSEFIRSIELPQADARLRHDRDFQIVPIFGMPIDAAATALKGCLTIPISNFNGVKVERSGEPHDLFTAGRRVAEIVLGSLKLRGADPIYIGLSSKQKVPGDVALHLNFINYFGGGLPPPEVWTEQFAPALVTVKTALVKRNVLSLRLKAFCHLSLGCLFGYIFRRTTGCGIDVEQISEGRVNIWSSHDEKHRNPLQFVEFPGEIGSRDLCVIINLMSGDRSSVKRHAGEHHISYRAVLELNPPKYPWTISGGEAVAIAQDLADKIKELHARYDTNTVHVFTAIPLGLSVLIGYNMNACGSVRCYEFDNGKREYFSSCTLA